MSALEVSVKATYGDGMALSYLSDLIEKRSQLLREAPKDAVKRTAVNVLTSLRARTGKAKKKNAEVYSGNWSYTISQASKSAGWAYPPIKGRRGGRRVVRDGNGHAVDYVNDLRIVNLAGDYKTGSNPQCYLVTIRNAEGKKWYPAQSESILCMANSMADVKRHVENRIRRRIGQYSGISRRLLGIAAKKIVNGSASGEGVLGVLAAKYASVASSGLKGSSGPCSVRFEDRIFNSIRTLRGGAGDVTAALNAAANRTRNIIERRIGAPLSVSPKIEKVEVS